MRKRRLTVRESYRTRDNGRAWRGGRSRIYEQAVVKGEAGGDSGLFQASIWHRPRACHLMSSRAGLIQAGGVCLAPCGYARSGGSQGIRHLHGRAASRRELPHHPQRRQRHHHQRRCTLSVVRAGLPRCQRPPLRRSPRRPNCPLTTAPVRRTARVGGNRHLARRRSRPRENGPMPAHARRF